MSFSAIIDTYTIHNRDQNKKARRTQGENPKPKTVDRKVGRVNAEAEGDLFDQISQTIRESAVGILAIGIGMQKAMPYKYAQY